MRAGLPICWIVAVLLIGVPILRPVAACVSNAIPFGVSVSMISNKSVGMTFTVSDASIGAGLAGKIDLRSYPNTSAWSADMTTSGCQCVVCDGVYPVITGNANVSQAFLLLGVGAVYVVPVINEAGITGLGDAIIIGFALVREVASTGIGSNWSTTLELLTTPYPVNDLTADWDGDGSTDYQEYVAGTNPLNSRSVFQVLNAAQEVEGLRVTWGTTTGKTYQLLRSAALTNGYAPIFTVTNAIDVTTNYLDTGVITNPAVQFYRVRIIP